MKKSELVDVFVARLVKLNDAIEAYGQVTDEVVDKLGDQGPELKELGAAYVIAAVQRMAAAELSLETYEPVNMTEVVARLREITALVVNLEIGLSDECKR